MNGLLRFSQVSNRLRTAIAEARQRALVASAFCRSEAFVEYLGSLATSVPERKLIVRWQARDLLSGASDLQLYSTATKSGWDVYINHELHAKAYLLDDVAIVGSANLTSRGMSGTPPQGNHELAIQVQDDGMISGWFNEMVGLSRLMDDELFSSIESDISSTEVEPTQSILNRQSFSPATMQLISRRDEIRLYTHDLFWTKDPIDLAHTATPTELTPDNNHDFLLLGIDRRVSLEQLATLFKESSAYQWLRTVIDQEIFFGELTQKLHEALSDDPRPFRKEVKSLLSNLLTWVERLAEDDFEIDQPSHSQRVRPIRHDPALDLNVGGNQQLTDEEWVICLGVYISHPRQSLTATHPAVLGLSRLLRKIGELNHLVVDPSYRSPDGLRGRLRVLARYDPEDESGNYPPPVPAAEECWNMYSNKIAELRAQLVQLRHNYGLDEDPDTNLLELTF